MNDIPDTENSYVDIDKLPNPTKESKLSTKKEEKPKNEKKSPPAKFVSRSGKKEKLVDLAKSKDNSLIIQT